MSKENKIWLIALFACVIILIAPVFLKNTIMGDDIFFQLNRIEGIKEALLAGQFPVRIYAYQLNGFGVPLGIFYPDLFFYFPAFLRVIGIPIIEVYQIFYVVILLSMALSAWYAFYLIGMLSKYKKPIRLGAVTAMLYISFWYVLFDLYKRVDLGEILSLIFFPLALAGILAVLYGDVKKWPLAVVAIFSIIHAHIISSIFLVIAIFFTCCYSWRQVIEKERKRAIVKAVAFSVLLNASFYIPFLYFYFNMDFRQPLVFTNDLVSQIGGSDSWDRWTIKFFFGLQFLWGAPITINLLLFAKQWIFSVWNNKVVIPSVAKWMFGMTLFFMFASTTAFPWQFIHSLPGLGWLILIQFPWRLMELATPCAVFCGAIALLNLVDNSKKNVYLLAIICIFVSMINIVLFNFSLEYMGDVEHISKEELKQGHLPSYNFDGSNDYIFSGNSFEEMSNKDGQTLSVNDVYTSASITAFKRQGTSISFTYESTVPTTIQLPLFYYEGYKALDSDGHQLDITNNLDHVMIVRLPSGTNTVNVFYAGLPIFTFSEVVTLISVLVFMGIILKENRNGIRGTSS